MHAWTDDEKRLFAQALALAEDAHRGATDKSGLPYITHPIRVAEMAHSAASAVVGVLHDVLEDAGARYRVAARTLLVGHPGLLAALNGVTRHAFGHETYRESIVRCFETSELAREVKLNDLADNMSPARMCSKELRKMAAHRYAWAFTLLLTRDADRATRAKKHAEVVLRRTSRLPWEPAIG